MPKFNDSVRRMMERMYEDEQLRSNLNDDEAKGVFTWAENWIASQCSAAADERDAERIARSEFTRVRQTLVALNTLAAKNTFTLSEGIAALEPQLKTVQSAGRADVLKLLTQFVAALWQSPPPPIQAQKENSHGPTVTSKS